MSEIWKKLKVLTPDLFTYPAQIQDNVLIGLDGLMESLATYPVILSDYRPGDERQHGKGTAIDFYVPEVDPLVVLSAVKNLKYFHGYGVYLNENNIVSFHVDMRTDRSADNPATWGAFIGPNSNGGRVYTYAGLESVVNAINKLLGINGTSNVIAFILVAGLLLAVAKNL